MRKCKFVVEYFFELIYLGKTYFFRVDIFLVFFHKNDMEVEKKKEKKDNTIRDSRNKITHRPVLLRYWNS